MDKFPESVDVGRVNPVRLCFRSVYVVVTVGVAVLFPYFNQVLAFSGSVIFWPLTVYFPVQMYFVHNRILPWTTKWILLRVYTIFCMLVMLFTLAGSLQGLISKRFG